MCIIEAMQAQAKKDMAAFRKKWGKPPAPRPAPKRKLPPSLYRRELERKARMTAVLDAMIPSAKETTQEIAARMGLPARNISAALSALQRSGRIVQHRRKNHLVTYWTKPEGE